MNQTPQSHELLPLEIEVQSVKQLLNEQADFLLIDCRETSEHEHCRIEGSQLIPMGETQTRVNELESHRQSRIVIHCHHGGRSLQVTNWLRSQGFAGAQNMTGGIDAWSLEIDQDVPRY